MNAHQPSPQTLLIVDDTPSNLGMVVGLFEERGYRVAVAQDGEEGIARAQRIRPDLILLDVMMPGIDGFEACRQLKADPETAEIPVVFMTALADISHKVAGFEVGGVDYVTKPLHLDEVVARVEIHLKLRAAQRQLAVQNAELALHRDHLEQLVAARTAELSIANETLRLKSRALNSAFDATYLIGSDLRLRYVNEAAVRALGYGREELLQMSLPDIDPTITPEIISELMRQTAANGRLSGTIESVHRRKNGTLFPVEIGATTFVAGEETLYLTMVRDISERKLAEERIRYNERKFRTLAENAPDSIARFGLGGRMVYVNPRLEAAADRPAAELLGRTMTQTRLVQDGAACERCIASVLATGQDAEIDVIFPDTGDGLRHHHLRFVAERDDQGEIIGALMVGRDITHLREHEAKLYASEQAFRAVVENSPDAIARYDRDARRVYVNPATQEMFGCSPEKLLGKTPRDYSPMVEGELFTEAILRVFASGQREDFEVTFHNAQGELRWGHSCLVPEFAPDGTVATVLGIGRDLHELKKSELRFRALADNFPDLLVRFDRDCQQLYVNPPAQALFAQELESQWPSEENLAQYRALQAGIRQAFASGEPNQLEAHWCCAQDEAVFEVRHIPEKDAAGKVVSVIGVARDITAQRRFERQLAESRDLLRQLSAHRDTVREEERKRIAREIHDELGQMLTAQRLDLATLRFQFGETHPAIDERCRRLMEIADSTIQVVRGIATALRPAALDMGLVPALEWLAAEFRSRSGVECRLHVSTTEIELEEPQSIALFRIIQESLTNVVRYAEAHVVDISLSGDEQFWHLAVHDDGKGFAAEKLPNRSFGIVGIHERALMLGGTASIDSAPGRGTTVEIHIPRHSVERALS